MEKSIHVVIKGRVQGVWFRGWTIREANQLGLSGWVKNNKNGNVEALFSGPSDKVDTMINACWMGPKNANVNKITKTSSLPPLTTTFSQLPDT